MTVAGVNYKKSELEALEEVLSDNWNYGITLSGIKITLKELQELIQNFNE